MKQILVILVLLFTFNCSNAQTTYYNGEWTKLNKTDLFSGIFQLVVKPDGTVKTAFIWTYLAVDSTNQELVQYYKDKKGASGIEYGDGTFNSETGYFSLEGKDLADPNEILGKDKYHLKLAVNKQVIYGSTETEGTNEGLFFGVKMNNADGEKEFAAASAKIKK